MEFLKQKIKSLKQKPMLLYGMGCLLLMALSTFFVYYLRVIYSPRWLGQIKGTIGVFVFLWFSFTAFCVALRLKNNHPHLFMAALLFVLGLVFTFATPPNQVPDEQTHFLRSYAMAQGQWGFDENHVYPDDVNSFILHFPVAHNNGYPAKEGNTVYNRFTEYYAGLESGEKAPNTSIIIFQVIPYIPGAVGIFLARAIGFGSLGAFYACRLANLIFFCVCAAVALKTAGKFKVIMFSLMAMPLMCFMYASCNSDSFLFRLMFLMFATVLGEKFDNRCFAVFTVCFAVLCTCKMSYVVFLPLLLCVSGGQWQVTVKDKKVNKLVAVVVCAFIMFLLYTGMGLYVKMFSNYGVIERTMSDTDPMAQLVFILKNPFRYAAVFFDTLKNNSFFLFSGGLLGWLDVNLPLVNYLSPIVVLFCCVRQAQVFEKKDAKKTAMFFVCSVLTYCVSMTGLYLTWTPVTLPQIIGMQARYVFPAFMGFCMVVGQYFSSKVSEKAEKSDLSCITIGYVFSLTAAVMMLIVYYLPERAVVFVA